MADDSPLPTQLANQAVKSLFNVVETQYTHTIHIDDAAGIYDCDCSGFVQYLLSQVGPGQLQRLQDATADNKAGRPLAHDFYTVFADLPTTHSNGRGGWLQIVRLDGADEGDIVAWSLHGDDKARDTGHCFVVASKPTQIADAENVRVTFAVQVYDSSSKKHFNDTRDDGSGFKGGVGSGVIHMQVDDNGVPVRFRFGDATTYHTKPIAIGRIEPLADNSADGNQGERRGKSGEQ